MTSSRNIRLFLCLAASVSADSDSGSIWPPSDVYWDGQCTACPAKLYSHCSRGGVLVGERSCGFGGMYCEGKCTEPLLSGAPEPTLYWDGQCTACPASLYADSHCALGGTIVQERGCGPAHAHCEAKCRLPPSTPTPQPELYWDGQCKACPARLYSHCSQGGTLVGDRGCGFLHVLCEGHCAKPAPAPEGADWIIVGGGASGCTAAAALADAGEDVLVLERGYSDLDVPKTEFANTWPEVVNTKAAQNIRWNDGTWGAVANVLGGGTEINGGLYIEEEPEYFEKNFGQDFNTSQFYESSRWVAEQLAEPLQPSSYGHRFVRALHEAKAGSLDPKPSLRMSSNSSWVAYSTFNTTERTWSRRGAGDLLHMRSDMTNLRFYTNYQVMKINFENGRATSVQVQNNFKETVTLAARKGVILAAGAIFTPQLLQVSGIGDPALLRDLGVPEVVSNPDVGQNFVDRNILNFGVWSSERGPLNVGYAMASNSSSQITFETEAWGKVASSFAIASLALVPPDQRTELLRKTMTPLFEGPIAHVMDNMIQFVALNHQTFSRGSVTAVSTDARKPPSVTANHLKDPRDLEQKFTAMAALQELIESQAMADLVGAKSFSGVNAVVPVYLSCIQNGPQTDAKAIIVPCLPDAPASREQYIEYFRKTTVSSYHYFSTASHGKVIDGPEFTVKGTSNLHVVDASVFPNPTRVNPQGTIMAMGHYIGTLLAKKEKARQLTEMV
ncbi:MDL4 [Symbiodinium necroappetens]|uniref:MDL4 protein n=1 Tax=Symbiodinium necroappetens TaxID=1628268 RepID=A0A812J1H6_9DINO|nr:MDL4 [Symbiodinium necroappetens]|mmetsp:Transcript_28999/g.69008  ORF Transcript_28999/g.69008 Transcript_28999/m.69008 type:complete len:728 (-) Transcript_28999:310-2493(-)|eukprot:CAMPEP_0181435206 /NCGR_PEP_ID=MMETSP1110-20121109/20213_1 /TAXON_ID=174948 /ORGANISM="Symbiodinium sp., Strain CCMP421" /LENGTH=727 /DNA_ID=CAMNT_0023558733 /DNA_START=75 /DNA_END=2258 /DNA_ORIENTATION=+